MDWKNKINCSGNRGMKISVIILGGALCAVLMAYIAFGDSNAEEGLRTLKMISILFRHGDRTPTDTYPNDPYKNYKWPGGKGALTEKGSLQLYNLGKNLRMRYYRLLPSNGLYSQEVMHVLSSYAERCIMSAQSLLSSFAPPLENRNVLPIPWQPIPVNSIPRDRDHLLAQRKACPKYDEILNKLYTHPPPDLKELNEKNADLYRLLTKHTGKNITDVTQVELLYNTLEIEQNAGFQLPDWTENIFPDKMLPLAEKSYRLFTRTSFMKKVKGGAFITEVYNNMLKKHRNLLNPDRRIFLYSGHDVTLVNVMNALNILDQTSNKPEYASALVFELHHSSTYKKTLEVKLFYYFNDEDKFPSEISIPKCESPCTLEEFGTAINDLLLDNFEEACEVPKTNNSCNK